MMKTLLKANTSIVLLAALLTGCASHERQLKYSGLDYVPGDRATSSMSSDSASTFSGEPTYHYFAAQGFANSADIEKAFHQYQKTGKKSPIIGSGFVTQPFDAYSKVLVACSPNQSAQVMLEAGEEITGMHLDNPTQWEVSQMTTGAGSNQSMLIIVTPQSLGLATNLTVGTNKRTYSIGFVSKKGFAPIINFWYPTEIEENYQSQVAMANLQKQRQLDNTVTPSHSRLSLDELQLNYVTQGALAIDGPEKIYSNGTETVLYWTALAKLKERPIVTADVLGERREIKASYYAPYYYIEGTYPEVTLSLPSDSSKKMRVIEEGNV